MLHFQKQNCQYLWIEAGIGGTNSVTNILSSAISAITSVGLDHQDVLGETIEEITVNKAGVIKQNTPIVIGKSVDK